MAESENPLHHDRYTRSNTYDADWVIANQMGPNALWLLESLTESLNIAEGAKVLDLGCGRAMTSIFLAKEFGANVWATDLWIDKESNQQRIDEAGVGDRAKAVHAEAHALLYEPGFFDVIVSIDAYQYFGTDDLYIGTMANLLAEGGQIGIVVPSLINDPVEVPGHIAPYWEWEYCCFHGPAWWRRHWNKTGLVSVDVADTVVDGWHDWLVFNDITAPTMEGWLADAAVATGHMLEADRGAELGFTRVVATKS